jgi:hypothetical protein
MDGIFLASLLIATGALLEAAALWLRRTARFRAALALVAVIPALVVAAAALTMRSPGPGVRQPHAINELTGIVALHAGALLAIALALIAGKRAGVLFWCVWIWNLAPLAFLIYLRFFFRIF